MVQDSRWDHAEGTGCVGALFVNVLQLYHSVQTHTQSYLQGSNVSVVGVLLSGGSKKIHPEGCIGGLKLLLQMFDIYQWCLRFILFMYLEIFACMEVENFLIVQNSYKDKFYGAFGVGYYYTRF